MSENLKNLWKDIFINFLPDIINLGCHNLTYFETNNLTDQIFHLNPLVAEPRGVGRQKFALPKKSQPQISDHILNIFCTPKFEIF